MQTNKEGVADKTSVYRVQVSPDLMAAYLIVEPIVNESDLPNLSEVLELLKAEKICYGIETTEIEKSLREQQGKPVCIAKGQAPLDGKDARLDFLFETGKFKKISVQDDAGKIDFHQLQTVQQVTRGQVIVIKNPATASINGMNVYGQEVQARIGKDLPLKQGKNVVWSEDGLNLIALITGEPSYVNGKVSVLEVHEINGNVNFDTGNIIFSGNVIVRGTVESGFKIEAEGEVIIHGSVEGAEIRAGGNLYVAGGISGMDKSVISSGGDLYAKYIERATIDCGGNLTVREAIMHSQINADGKINVSTGKGLIVGGVLRCGEVVVAKNIGSRLGTVTELEVGVTPKLKMEYQELENKLKCNHETIEKAEKGIAVLNRTANSTSERQACLKDLMKTVYQLKGINEELEVRKQELLEEMITRLKLGQIKVSELIFPGTRVAIGRVIMNIQDELRYSVLFYHEGEILIKPFR